VIETPPVAQNNAGEPVDYEREWRVVVAQNQELTLLVEQLRHQLEQLTVSVKQRPPFDIVQSWLG